LFFATRKTLTSLASVVASNLQSIRSFGWLAIAIGLVCWFAICSGAISAHAEEAGIPDATAADENPQAVLEFNRDIRPILSENCFHCHGPDSASRAAGLRLDDRESAIDSGAITPDQVSDSEMIRRIHETDPDTIMPPPESNKTLSDEQKERLATWIAQGAAYQNHWSFEPLTVAAEGPQDIDGFISGKLAARKLNAAPPASRERWLRRVTLDLTGLPPSIEEIDDFLNDSTEDAFEDVVDRLLASPAYGERMTAEWLDVARYSDTYGYQVDRDRFVWPWRDWVIQAFNENMPYDQFLTEQLAGDLLPNATREQILATTFNRLHPQKVEGGSVEEEFRVEYVVDRAQTVSTAFMGLTFECARCHDHKFDPLTQKEFYELNAFFANINEAGLYSFHTNSVPTPTLQLPSANQQEQLLEANQAVQAADQAWSEAKSSIDISTVESLNAVTLDEPIASVSFDESDKSYAGFELVDKSANKSANKAANKSASGDANEANSRAARLSGDKGVDVGPAPFRRWQAFSVALWMQTPDRKERAVIYHASLGWTDAASRGYELLLEDGRLSASLIHYWPGNAISIRTKAAIPVEQWLHVTVTYDGSSRASGLQICLNGQPVECEIRQDCLTKEITAGNAPHLIVGERTRDRGFTNGLVDSIQVFDRELTQPEISAVADNKPAGSVLADGHVAKLPKQDIVELLSKYASPPANNALAQLETARKKRDQLLDGITEIMVMRELEDARDTYILDRGAYDARTEKVSPGTPAALPAMPLDLPRNRLGLAQWLTDPSHPLTARVAVNRYWQLIFGRGLVLTTEDFGSQGSPPSHPELLDWLANRFIETGWDVQALLKTMVLSDAYRRDSDFTDETHRKDPENIFLARGPSAPLTAEMIRDSALAVSGLISEKIGGKSARPYELAVSFKPITPDTGEGLYRRSLYTFWKRTSPAPVMLVLDASTRDVCRVRRERTSSPLQAMVLLNGSQYVEAAQGAAAEVLLAVGKHATPEMRLTRLFRQLTGRTPTAMELPILTQLWSEQQADFAANPDAATKFLSTTKFEKPDSVDVVELAAMSVVAQAIMNLDDCLMKR
jgi:mono/diheme cytochrome c family protein